MSGKIRVSSEEQPLYVSVVLKFFDMGLSPYEQAAYLWLKRRSGKDNPVWESVPNMAKSAGMSERRFHTALDRLQALGMIRAKARSGQTTEFVLLDQGEWTDPATLAPDAGVSAPTPAPRATPPAPDARVPLHDMQGTLAPRADKVTTTKKQQGRNNPKKKEDPKHEFDPATVDLPPQFDRERFTDFCATRLKTKSPMTAIALRRFINKHQHHDRSTLDQMFDNAIVGNWKDLYPLKDRDNALARRGGNTPEARAAESATDLLAHLERRKAS